MGRQLTLGRYPTLGEVLDYYARDDFLDFLLCMLAQRIDMPVSGFLLCEVTEDSPSKSAKCAA